MFTNFPRAWSHAIQDNNDNDDRSISYIFSNKKHFYIWYGIEKIMYWVFLPCFSFWFDHENFSLSGEYKIYTEMWGWVNFWSMSAEPNHVNHEYIYFFIENLLCVTDYFECSFFFFVKNSSQWDSLMFIYLIFNIKLLFSTFFYPGLLLKGYNIMIWYMYTLKMIITKRLVNTSINTHS